MRRKIYSFILIVTMLLVLMPDTAMAAKMEGKSLRTRETVVQTGKTDAAVAAGVPVDMEGSGTAVDPYRIKSAEQLRAFADMVNGTGGAPDTGLCAVLTQKIDLSGVCDAETGSWTPIGTKKTPYTGTFDGGSYTVSGLYYHKPDTSYAGLFGCNAGTIRNLGVVGSDIAAGSYTGGVCGSNRGTIAGCYNASPVSGDSYTGGICGYNDGSGIVSVCYNTGTVSGGKYVGGICGYNRNEASNCYNMGTVNGSGTSVGGVCGYNKKLVSACYNTGEVGGKDYVGSVCGYNHSESAFLNCYYLITGTEKGSYGAGMTRQQFASGEVCWLLNGGKSENVVWHQTCGAGFPAFGGKTVYQTQIYKGSGSSVFAYTNDKNKNGAQPYTAPAAENSGGTVDGNTGGHVYQEPEWEWDEEKYQSAVAVFTCQDCGGKLRMEATISRKRTSSCGEEGGTIYTASVERDDKTYVDTRTDQTEKEAHETLVWVRESAATCEEPGYTKDCWTCLACGACFEDETGKKELKKVRIRALGHKYEGDPRWIPESDYSAVTAEFVCARSCGKVPEVRRVKTKVVSSNATCMTAGTTTYSAVVNFNGKNYKYKEDVPGQTLPHNYGGNPVWDWPSVDGPASAVFGCRNKGCSASYPVPATITSAEVPGTDCSSPGKTIYTAEVEYDGRIYTDKKEKELPAQHGSMTRVPAEKETCGKAGNVEHWLCSVCGRAFADQAGTVPLRDTVIPATGEHKFKHVKDNIYKCDSCGGTYIVTESGAESVYSVEDGVIQQENDSNQQDEKKNDNTVGFADPDGEKADQAEPVREEPSLQSGPEEKQEETVPRPAEGQAGQNGQPGESVPGGQDEQPGESVRTGQDEQPGEEMRKEQGESRDGVIDAPENVERQELIYPEGAETGTDSVAEDAREESAVSLRAEAAGNSAETVWEQQGLPAWGSAAVLAVLVGIVLAVVLKKENN